MKPKIGRGATLGELVKGSLDYTVERVTTAFNQQFMRRYDDSDVYVSEVFADYVIVRKYGEPPDEYLRVPFTLDAEGEIVFAPPAEWEPVELTYQPQTANTGVTGLAGAGAEGAAQAAGDGLQAVGEQAAAATPSGQVAPAGATTTGASASTAVAESASAPSASAPSAPAAAATSSTQSAPPAGNGKRRGRRLDEGFRAGDGPRVTLGEAKNDAGKATRRIQIKGLMTAGVVNGNGRRYPAAVLEAAVEVWRSHLHESAGQGRLKLLTGEADHPADKGHKTAQFLETCVKWDEVTFDGRDVDVAGDLILTSRGRDVLTLMEAGVMPGGSVRGYYESTKVREGDAVVEDVAWCEITGADLVGDPSFTNQADLLESRRPVAGAAAPDGATAGGDETMDLEQLRALIQQHPELFKELVKGEVKSMSEAQLTDLDGRVRKLLGVAEGEDLTAALQEVTAARRELAEARQMREVATAVNEACQGLPYVADLNKAFRTALEGAGCKSAAEVKTLAEAKRREYDQIASSMKLASMGRVQVIGSVLEQETGTPEFARGAQAFSEALQVRGLAPVRNLAQPKTINERVAQKVLRRFDQLHQRELMLESRLLQETELASDLNLPYSALRTIVQEVWPQLVATSIFDVDVTDSPMATVFYEDYQDVPGKHVTVADEAVTAGLDTWVQLAHRMIEANTVVVTNEAGTVPYAEGTDYVIDFIDGKLYAISGGSISDNQVLHVDYHYDKVREGENQAIQRAKLVTNSAPLICKANRLATQITAEAMLFSRSTIGWDATARTLAGLTQELKRELDRALLYTSLTRALMVPQNSGGTYTAATDPLIKWVEALGAAKVKVTKRYFDPTFILLSTTNSDALGNWDGFTNAGGRADSGLNANGYVYRLKGLPVFSSTEFSDGYGEVGNAQVVQYRVFKPWELKGPFASYDSDGHVIAADQYYVEGYDGWVSPVAGKAAYMKVA